MIKFTLNNIMNMKHLIISMLAACMCVPAFAAEKATYIYDVAGTDTLRVDVYTSPAIKENAPAVIFAFGG